MLIIWEQYTVSTAQFRLQFIVKLVFLYNLQKSAAQSPWRDFWVTKLEKAWLLWWCRQTPTQDNFFRQRRETGKPFGRFRWPEDWIVMRNDEWTANDTEWTKTHFPWTSVDNISWVTAHTDAFAHNKCISRIDRILYTSLPNFLFFEVLT